MKKKKVNGKSWRERQASKNSQFDPRIPELGRQGFGFQMKKGYKSKPEGYQVKIYHSQIKNDH